MRNENWILIPSDKYPNGKIISSVCYFYNELSCIPDYCINCWAEAYHGHRGANWETEKIVSIYTLNTPLCVI